jgi:quercetin dioxygenase-like cupin family protein
MAESSRAIVHLASAVEPLADAIVSKTVYQDDAIKAVAFGFGAGQELSEHTASTSAIMHFLQGEADVTLDAERLDAGPGTWIHMPPGMRHSIRAKTPVSMLLLLLKSKSEPAVP